MAHQDRADRPSPPAAAAADAMTPSTLDLFMLTFNCAKNLINVAVFAAHLQAALRQNATGLPDLVVFSLQEVAPLSYSFIGSYFLNPYLARFEEALNLAAVQVAASTPAPVNGTASSSSASLGADSAGDEQRQRLWAGEAGRPGRPYHLVRAKNVGMTAIMLFARTPEAVRRLEEAECGFGAADMGNKGAVGLRIAYAAEGAAEGAAEVPRETELTFVATHLAAMEWNLGRRNANWRRIVSGLTFADPKSVVPAAAAEAATPQPGDGDEDAQPLLGASAGGDAGGAPLTPAQARALHDTTIFKPTSHLFLAGDLNYRISATTPPPLAPFPRLDPSSPDHYPRFFERDQLTQERAAGRTCTGLSEAAVRFPPTYKLDVLDGPEGAENEGEVRRAREEGRDAGPGVDVVPWKWAPHRWPGWCDRVLYLDVPGWARRRLAAAGEPGRPPPEVRVDAYSSLPALRTSDHRPVFVRARVPLLTAREMGLPAGAGAGGEGEQAAAAGAAGLTAEERDDPRARLPVAVDVGAWGRRATARRRELAVGWSMLLWSTREGAVAIATALLLGVGGWWILQEVW